MDGRRCATRTAFSGHLVKPIGVSTQFVIADAAVWDIVQPDIIVTDDTTKSGYASPNAYLNKSGGKYAAAAKDLLNYSFVFVLAMMGGAALSAILKGDKPHSATQKTMPPVWENRFGNQTAKRYIACFIAGFIVLFGARLAGGCTSGHMMSGMMQTALRLFCPRRFCYSHPAGYSSLQPDHTIRSASWN